MKKPQSGHNYFFVDESGDPTFYDRRGNFIAGTSGCSPILILGFIETQTPQVLRRNLLALQHEIITDPYFQEFPSLARTAIAFHAKDDVAEIRYRVFKFLATLEFHTQFIVARKIEHIFRNQFHTREMEFYDELVSKLFQNVLHRYTYNTVYFAKRGSRDRQAPLSYAIQRGKARFERKWGADFTCNFSVQAQTPSGEPCLSIIDYMNWAVYRAFTRQEMRYYRTVENKVSLLVDYYDYDNYPNNWYNHSNPFDITKITPL